MKNTLMKLTPAVKNCWCNAEPYFRADNPRLGIYAISCLNPECDNHRVALGRGAVDTAELWNAMVADHAEIARLHVELATLDIAHKEAIAAIAVDRNNAERWRSECLNAREEARRLQALIERRRIEAENTRANAFGQKKRALSAERGQAKEA